MKSVLFLFLSTVCFLSIAQETPKRDIFAKKAKAAKRITSLGGMVVVSPTGNVFRVVNAQSHVSDDVLRSVARDIGMSISSLGAYSSIPQDADLFKAARLAKAIPKTGAAVLVVDRPGVPALIPLPEESVAIVNVNPLIDDLPPNDILCSRVRKEIWRGAAFVMGGTDSQMQPCLISDIRSLKDLDACKMPAPSTEVAVKMLDNSHRYGIDHCRRATYQRACQEGWAPAPTNDVQKAIWDKVHAIPSTPMKIEFDPKKGR